MASNMNFKGFGNEPPPEGSGSGRPSGNFPLVSQSSIYSLTFDEFRNSLGREFGSMNMDELLKNIWTAEETQNMAPTAAPTVNGGGQVGGSQGGYLQRQGSVTLPRTLSQKTVDEVWKDVSKEFRAGKDTGAEASVPQATKRQPTLGEITLEEFLVRAGVVREDAQFGGKPNPGGFLGDIVQANNGNTGFGIDFQQPSRGVGLMGSHLIDNSARIPLQSPTLPVNVNGMRSSQPQPQAPQQQQQQQQHQQQHQQSQQPPIYPKQSAVSYAPTMTIPGNTQVGLTNRTANGMQGMGGGGVQGGAMGVAAGSPAAFSTDRIGKSKGDTPSVSPHPFMFNGGLRGRKSNHQVEKVIERRQRRMIKNRESAARSRQRKQAYTEELEEEVNKLKKENEELQQKQAQVIEMQKNEMLEMVRKGQLGARRTRLKRTHTGPW